MATKRPSKRSSRGSSAAETTRLPLGQRLAEREVQINTLKQTINEHEATITQLQTDSAVLRDRLSEQQVVINRLKAQAAAAVAGTGTRTTPGALVDSFRRVVDQVQSQARAQSSAGPTTTIRSMDIEAKVVLDVGDDGGAVLVLPGVGTTVDASQLSTVRVSFAAIPGTGAGPPPVVTEVAPTSGPQSGGTTVQIKGNGFTGAGSVLFGGIPATTFTVASDSQVAAVSPVGTGAVDIVVITGGGASATTKGDQFLYAPVPVITRVEPARGAIAGGQKVVIGGSGFTGVTSVSFGQVPAREFKVGNDAVITAVSPQIAAPGTVHISATSPGGTSTPVAQDQFTYALR